MARRRVSDQEAGYLDSLWRELRTMEADYGAITSILAQPSARPGVFTFRVEFTPLRDREGDIIGRQAITIAFPNATTQTLAGALWSASLSLTNQISALFYDKATRPRNGA